VPDLSCGTTVPLEYHSEVLATVDPDRRKGGGGGSSADPNSWIEESIPNWCGGHTDTECFPLNGLMGSRRLLGFGRRSGPHSICLVPDLYLGGECGNVCFRKFEKSQEFLVIRIKKVVGSE